MKKFVLSCLALWLTAVASHSQTITRILPTTGYHHWEKVEFKTSLKGSAETRWGKEIITTTDGGKTWVKKIAAGVESAESVPPLKKIQLDGRMGSYFLARSPLGDTAYVGTTDDRSPYILLAGRSGKYWKVLNGATYNSVSSFWTDTKSMVIADNYGNIFFSDDKASTFTRVKSGNRNGWPELNEHKGKLYYFDEYPRVDVSHDSGKTWKPHSYIKYNRPVQGVYIENDSVRYIIADKTLMKLQHGTTPGTTIATLNDDKFIKLKQHGTKAITITQRGNLFTLENDKWTKTILDTTIFLTGVAFDGTHIAITTANNKVLFSEDGNTFKTLITPIAGYNAYSASFYKKYLIVELRDARSMKGNDLWIYDMETKKGVTRSLDVGEYEYGTIGFYENYIYGTGGSLHKIDLP